MSDLLILGTDTGVGKTTFALLWLGAFGEYEYWKPIETGPSDTGQTRLLTPAAVIHPPLLHLADPVAPPLAARREGVTIPPAAIVSAARPQAGQLLIETFGSPFSPLNETELQITLIRALNCPSILVSSSVLGTVGRTLQCLYALEAHGHLPAAIVLLGARDDYAVEQVRRYRTGLAVVCLTAPEEWTSAGIDRSASEQREALQTLQEALAPAPQLAPNTLARDKEFVWHPYTSLRDPDPPLVCLGAQDEFLHIADGRRIVDGISSWWTILHGHRFAPLMDALREAAAVYDHVHFAGITHPAAVELAGLLLGTMPWRGGRVFYSDNGSTAVEVALKMAYQFWCHQGEPRRTRFIGFEHGYHGDTFGAMSVSRDPVFFGQFEPLLFQAAILPLDASALDDYLREHPGEVAAVIVEPLVQGAGGMRMHGPEELRGLFEAAKKHGALFIADEVMTGGGRLGWLWAHRAAGIAPDLVCAAKTLTGGVLPLAATLAAPHVAAAWETDDRSRTFFHGHSFTAHPLACAVALANWRMLNTAFPESPRQMELFWKKSLMPLAEHPTVKEVRIRGSIAAIEVKGEESYLADVSRQMRRTCLAHGVLLRPLGPVLYAMPPLGIRLDSLERMSEAMIQAAVNQD